MNQQKNHSPEMSGATVIDIKYPALGRYWKTLVERNPDLKEREESFVAGDTIIAQERVYHRAFVLLDGQAREELVVEHQGIPLTKELRILKAGRVGFAEALSEEYADQPARYSVVAETRTTIVRIDRAWLNELTLLRGKGNFEFDLVLELIRTRQEQLDSTEQTLRDRIQVQLDLNVAREAGSDLSNLAERMLAMIERRDQTIRTLKHHIRETELSSESITNILREEQPQMIHILAAGPNEPELDDPGSIDIEDPERTLIDLIPFGTEKPPEEDETDPDGTAQTLRPPPSPKQNEGPTEIQADDDDVVIEIHDDDTSIEDVTLDEIGGTERQTRGFSKPPPETVDQVVEIPRLPKTGYQYHRSETLQGLAAQTVPTETQEGDFFNDEEIPSSHSGTLLGVSIEEVWPQGIPEKQTAIPFMQPEIDLPPSSRLPARQAIVAVQAGGLGPTNWDPERADVRQKP